MSENVEKYLMGICCKGAAFVVFCIHKEEGSGCVIRLLIADSSDLLASALTKQLKSQFLVKFCDNGDKTLAAINSFDPDILLIDLRLTGTDSLTIIRALGNSGRNVKILVTAGFAGDHTLSLLETLGVMRVFIKPCDVASVVCAVRDVANQIENGDEWNLPNEVDRLLLSLGFRMGRTAYACTFDALCMKFENFELATTKEVYPAVAKKYGGNTKQVEKAIRDAIKTAWSTSNQNLWKLYFQPKADEEAYCPSNDEFLCRMAKALMCGKRLRLPYVEKVK